MPPQVRLLQPSDEPQWRNLWNQYQETTNKRSIPENITSATFSRFLDPNTRMYGAVAVAPSDPSTSSNSSEEQIIGFVNWYPHPSTSSLEETVYLHDLFVSPDARLGGSGRALIEFVFKHTEEVLGADSVYWHTANYNHRAQLLYVKVAEKTVHVVYRKAFKPEA